MAWQLYVVVFFFFSSGSLLSHVESTVYKRGVQHDVPVSSLVAAGCVSCYEKPNGSVSKSQDIGYPASALFSEGRHHGIKEQGIVREGVRGRDRGASIDLSRSLQLAKDIPVDKNVTVGALQAYTTRQPLSEETLLAAVTKTVKVITNITDVLVYFRNYSSILSPYAAKKSYSTNFDCYAILRKSKSFVFLQRLNKYDFEFAPLLSEILKVDVTLSYFYLWGQLPLRSTTDVTFSSAFRKPTPKSDRSVGTLIIVIVVLIASLAMLFMLYRFLRSDKGPCAPIREDQVEARAVVQIAGTYYGLPTAASSGLPSAYAVAFAVPPASSSVQSGIAVNGTLVHMQVPSARATPVNSAEASIYETATAVVAGNAV